MTFVRLQPLAGIVIGWLGVSHAALASDPAVEARIQRLEAGLQPPVLVNGETPALTPLARRMAELKVPGVSTGRRGRLRARRFRPRDVRGLETAPRGDISFNRMDDTRSRAVLEEAAAIAKRVKDQMAYSGSEDTARHR